ncbi:MAG: glycosyltransferase [Magnetococcales bacterium]|nr:glycosyltransferase [Magnetococcales bacterium]
MAESDASFTAQPPVTIPRQLLIVSPHFPPINAPDHQRVRMSLPYLAEFGWRAHVLAVDPALITGTIDPGLSTTIPPETPITWSHALPLPIARCLGLKGIAYRALFHLYRDGLRLLRRHPCQLVYFSTTLFPVMALGPLWQRRLGIPYVLDFQDPWRRSWSEILQTRVVPGNRIKYLFSHIPPHLLEPWIVRHASHLICNSAAYRDTFLRRYVNVKPERISVLPFGVPTRDFAHIAQNAPENRFFNHDDGTRNWVSLGASNASMAYGYRVLFTALHTERASDPEGWRSVRLHFIGTSYGPGDRAEFTVLPIARELGVADMVQEHPHRIPYFLGLRILTESDLLLMVGSDNAGYSASRTATLLYSRRPILGILRAEAPVTDLLRDNPANRVGIFDPNGDLEKTVADLRPHLRHFLRADRKQEAAPPDLVRFAPLTARFMTEQQCLLFDQVAGGGRRLPSLVRDG